MSYRTGARRAPPAARRMQGKDAMTGVTVTTYPRRRPRRQTRAALGFTLIEIVMVLFIMAIVAAMAAPRYSQAIARYRLESAAGRVAADLEYARALARSTSTSLK